MPVRTNVSNRRMPGVSRQANGTNDISGIPNPNSGGEIFKRNNPGLVAGSHGSAQLPSGLNDQRQPLSLAGLDMAANATDQGDSQDYAAKNRAQIAAGTLTSAEAMNNERNDRFNKTAVSIMNPNGRRFAQSLYNAGADKIRTGAAAGYDAPGFFDQQDPNSQQRKSLSGLLAVRDVNNYGRKR